MSREWKPGDVAMASTPGLPDFLVVRMADAYWSAPSDWPSGVDPRDCDYRRLVVIDPEDTETVRGALEEWTRGAFGYTATASDVAAFSAILRDFADPQPPKPDEPTGLGAVVEDAHGNRWVKVFDRGSMWQRNDDRGIWKLYADIDAVKVLSEGVTA